MAAQHDGDVVVGADFKVDTDSLHNVVAKDLRELAGEIRDDPTMTVVEGWAQDPPLDAGAGDVTPLAADLQKSVAGFSTRVTAAVGDLRKQVDQLSTNVDEVARRLDDTDSHAAWSVDKVRDLFTNIEPGTSAG